MIKNIKKVNIIIYLHARKNTEWFYIDNYLIKHNKDVKVGNIAKLKLNKQTDRHTTE